MKKFLSYLIVLLILTASCQSEVSGPAAQETLVPQEFSINNYNYREVPDRLLALRQKGVADTLLLPLQGNLFGRFFQERVEFFIVKRPTNRVYDTGVKSLTMYYLDGRLSQTKFILEQNAVDRLIALYGGFRIKGFDAKNREIIKANQVVNLSEQGVIFNSELDNYELKWDIGHTQIAYKVNHHDYLEPFKYFERLKDFEKVYQDIRRVEY